MALSTARSVHCNAASADRNKSKKMSTPRREVVDLLDASGGEKKRCSRASRKSEYFTSPLRGGISRHTRELHGADSFASWRGRVESRASKGRAAQFGSSTPTAVIAASLDSPSISRGGSPISNNAAVVQDKGTVADR